MEQQESIAMTTDVEQPDGGKLAVGSLVRHAFEWYMNDELRSGRVACFRKVVDLPFVVPKGMRLEIAGTSGGNLHAGDVELNVDTGVVTVHVTRGFDLTEKMIYEQGCSLLEYGWELYFEDNAHGVVPFADMDEPSA